jgi:hypothetical protein
VRDAAAVVAPSRRQPAAEVEMSRRRWVIWLGPPVALLAIALALSRFQAGAEAGGRSTALPVGACVAPPIEKDGHGKANLAAGDGAWWSLSGRLDPNGALTGRHLALGHGGSANLALELAPDTLVSGPVGGIVALTTDDGRHSQIRLVAQDKACSFVVAETAEVARGAVLDPSDGAVIAHVVDRESRADLGTWRYAADGSGQPTLVGPALQPDPKRGPNWTTDLRLDGDGNLLAIQSCTDTSCLTRVFDLRKGLVPVATLEGEQGSMIGLTSEGLLTWDQCLGLPCGIVHWTLPTGASVVVVARAESAAVSANGKFLVAVTDASVGGIVRVDLESGAVKGIRGVNRNERLVSGGVLATQGIQLRPDEVGLAAEGTNPRPFSPAGAEVLP